MEPNMKNYGQMAWWDIKNKQSIPEEQLSSFDEEIKDQIRTAEERYSKPFPWVYDNDSERNESIEEWYYTRNQKFEPTVDQAERWCRSYRDIYYECRTNQPWLNCNYLQAKFYRCISFQNMHCEDETEEYTRCWRTSLKNRPESHCHLEFDRMMKCSTNYFYAREGKVPSLEVPYYVKHYPPQVVSHGVLGAPVNHRLQRKDLG